MNIPPLISRTPPPLPDDDDDEDDEEFGSYVIGDIIDNGSNDIYRSINGETSLSAYDFIQSGSVGPLKDSPEKINLYKNGVDSPTTSSTKDHLPDVIPDCDPVVPSSPSSCDDTVSNGKDVPSYAPGTSLTQSECWELSNGVVDFATQTSGNESDSFVGTVTVEVEKQVSSNEICSDTIATHPNTFTKSGQPEVITDPEEAHMKEYPSVPDLDDFTSFAFEKAIDQKKYSDEKVVFGVAESPSGKGLPLTESQIVCESHPEPPDENSAVLDTDFNSSVFERPIDQNHFNSYSDDPSGEIKGFPPSPSNSLDPSKPRSYEAPSDVDEFTNRDPRVEDISTISDADEFTSFAFEKPIDLADTGNKATADLSNLAKVPSSITDPPDASTVPDIDEFTSFEFEKPITHGDGFGGAGSSGAADVEADEFSDFADFQTSSEADFVFQETAPAAEFPKEDAEPGDDVEEFDAALVGSIDGNTVWCRLRYLEDTPALKYQWLSSSSNHKLLSALKIDSRNIFCGPWSRSSKIVGSDLRSGPHHELLGAPSAVHHERCHLHEASGDPNAKPSVPDAHFDWEGSGLVNPLFGSAKDDEILHCDIGGIIGNQTSSQAAKILKSLPDLSYVTKTYLVFKPLPAPL